MIGTTLNGKYKLTSMLAESHLYEVYQATEIETGGTVIIKVMREEIAASLDQVKFFSDEVQAFGRLTHPNVAQILDMDMIGNRPYVVREPVSGIDFRTWARQEKGVPFLAAVKAVQSLGFVLQAAFDEGIDHRTVKTSNVLRRDDGMVKVLGFSMPRLRLVKKTPTMIDLEASIQSDLYFLGITLFELLTGDSPIRKRGTINETWDDLLRQSLRIRHQQLPPEAIDKVVEGIDRTLTRDVKSRFTDHTEFLVILADLIHLAEGLERGNRPVRREMASASEVVDAIQGRKPLTSIVTGVGPANHSKITALPKAAATQTTSPSAMPAARIAPLAQSSARPVEAVSPSATGVSRSATAGGKVSPINARAAKTASIAALNAAEAAQLNAFDGNAALALDPQECSQDPDDAERPVFGRPIFQVINGGRSLAKSVIWRITDEPIWYKNPMVIMGGGLLFMLLLILFW